MYLHRDRHPQENQDSGKQGFTLPSGGALATYSSINPRKSGDGGVSFGKVALRFNSSIFSASA